MTYVKVVLSVFTFRRFNSKIYETVTVYQNGVQNWLISAILIFTTKQLLATDVIKNSAENINLCTAVFYVKEKGFQI